MRGGALVKYLTSVFQPSDEYCFCWAIGGIKSNFIRKTLPRAPHLNVILRMTGPFPSKHLSQFRIVYTSMFVSHLSLLLEYKFQDIKDSAFFPALCISFAYPSAINHWINISEVNPATSLYLFLGQPHRRACSCPILSHVSTLPYAIFLAQHTCPHSFVFLENPYSSLTT